MNHYYSLLTMINHYYSLLTTTTHYEPQKKPLRTTITTQPWRICGDPAVVPPVQAEWVHMLCTFPARDLGSHRSLLTCPWKWTSPGLVTAGLANRGERSYNLPVGGYNWCTTGISPWKIAYNHGCRSYHVIFHGYRSYPCLSCLCQSLLPTLQKCRASSERAVERCETTCSCSIWK